MHSRALSTIAVLAGLLVPAAACAAPRTITVDPDHATASWEGTPTPAANVGFFEESAGLAGCGTSPTDYCDDTLVHFAGAGPFDDSGLTFRIEGFDHSDYDLRVYTSDATGAQGDYLGNGTGDGTGALGAALPTFMGDPETYTTFADPDTYYLVRVVYFAVPGDEAYAGKVSWAGTPATGEAAPAAS
jgi:hypothetical protein